MMKYRILGVTCAFFIVISLILIFPEIKGFSSFLLGVIFGGIGMEIGSMYDES